MSQLADLGCRLPGGVELPERYVVRRRIARGGMASVWCAEDRVLGRSVAIKLLCEPFARDNGAVRRFKREARAAARLAAHPHVVTIFDVGEAPARDCDRGHAFMVMEFVAGGTVADALRVGAAPRDEVIRWLRQAASAVDYAHSRGVIHRDIKPANFLLDCDRLLKVADFGIAQLGTEDTLTSTGQMLGTAAYAAPERALGSLATEASDRYSLAIAAYELLVGERPFISDNFAVVIRRHVEEEPPPASSRNPSLPKEVDAILARGLAKEPEDRWPTAVEFADALAHAVERADARRRLRAAVGLLTGVGGAVPEAAAELAAVPAASRRPAGPGAGRSPGRRGPRVAAGAAIMAALLLCGTLVAMAASGGPSAKRSPALESARSSTTAAHSGAKARARSEKSAGDRSASRRSVSSSGGSTAAAGGSTSPASGSTTAAGGSTASTAGGSMTTTDVPVATGSSASTAESLQARGHTLMQGGDYSAAISLLRQAAAAAQPSSDTYAYALYDLGRSLRLSGDPQAAIPVLQRRLQIPNQTGVVQTELTLAEQAAGGAAPTTAGGGAPAPGAVSANPSSPAAHGAGASGDWVPGGNGAHGHGHAWGHSGRRPGHGGTHAGPEGGSAE